MSFVTGSRSQYHHQTDLTTPNQIDPALLDLSQETSDSNPETPLTITLNTTGKDRSCYEWTSSNKDKFEAWWSGTTWYKENEKRSKRIKVPWGADRRSATWEHFLEGASKIDGTPKVICSRCNQVMAHAAINGTTTVNEHLFTKTCQKASSRNGFTQITLETSFQKMNQKTKPGIFDDGPLLAKDWNELFIKAVVSMGIPLSCVENPDFQRSYLCLQPNLRFPARSTLRSRLIEEADSIEAKIYDDLPKDETKVSLALDGWSAINNRQGFLAILAYWIDTNWNYNEVLLDFVPLYQKHTGIKYAEVVKDVLHRYQLKKRVQALTTDNAAVNKSMFQNLKDFIEEQNTQLLNRGGANKVELVPCLAHVIQLSLGELLRKLNVKPDNDSIETTWNEAEENQQRKRYNEGQLEFILHKCRKIATFINSSSQRLEVFKKIQVAQSQRSGREPISQSLRGQSRPLKLFQDVRTRWNSTCIMLVRFLLLRAAVQEYLENDDVPQWLSMAPTDWKQIEYLIDLTRPFLVFTNLISRSRCPTIHQVFLTYNTLFGHLEKLKLQLRFKRREWKKSLLQGLEEAIDKLRKYYSKTQNSLGHLYGIATLLAPSYKDNFFRNEDWVENDRAGNLTWEEFYKSRLTELYDTEYKYRDFEQVLSRPDVPSENSPSWSLTQLLHGSRRTASIQDTDELDLYFNRTPLTSTTIEVLEQWRSLSTQFPRLGQMARDVLAVPGSSAGVERVFSIARSMWSFNQQYSPDTFRALMKLRYYYQRERELDRRARTKDETILEFSSFIIDQDEEELAAEEEMSRKEYEQIMYISDDEDDEEGQDLRIPTRRPQTRLFSQRASYSEYN